MHFFIEQYLSIILKLLKIVARMIPVVLQIHDSLSKLRVDKITKPFRVNPLCVCSIYVCIYVYTVL